MNITPVFTSLISKVCACPIPKCRCHHHKVFIFFSQKQKRKLSPLPSSFFFQKSYRSLLSIGCRSRDYDNFFVKSKRTFYVDSVFRSRWHSLPISFQASAFRLTLFGKEKRVEQNFSLSLLRQSLKCQIFSRYSSTDFTFLGLTNS